MDEILRNSAPAIGGLIAAAVGLVYYWWLRRQQAARLNVRKDPGDAAE